MWSFVIALVYLLLALGFSLRPPVAHIIDDVCSKQALELKSKLSAAFRLLGNLVMLLYVKFKMSIRMNAVHLAYKADCTSYYDC